MHRDQILGSPHTYLISAHCVLGAPLLARDDGGRPFLDLLERVRQVFDVRLYGWILFPDRYHLVVRHRIRPVGSEDDLRRRWSHLGGSKVPPTPRLRERMTSLSGLMQTLSQRYSRTYNRRHGGRGTIWAGRYRACLLADDPALLAALAWIIDGQHDEALMHCDDVDGDHPHLTPPPLICTPDGWVVAADEAPRHLMGNPSMSSGDLLHRFFDQLDGHDTAIYGAALRQSWAIGRPESLGETLARLQRPRGRGRHRQMRELDDSQGLCGIWG